MRNIQTSVLIGHYAFTIVGLVLHLTFCRQIKHINVSFILRRTPRCCLTLTAKHARRSGMETFLPDLFYPFRFVPSHSAVFRFIILSTRSLATDPGFFHVDCEVQRYLYGEDTVPLPFTIKWIVRLRPCTVLILTKLNTVYGFLLSSMSFPLHFQ